MKNLIEILVDLLECSKPGWSTKSTKCLHDRVTVPIDPKLTNGVNKEKLQELGFYITITDGNYFISNMPQFN